MAAVPAPRPIPTAAMPIRSLGIFGDSTSCRKLRNAYPNRNGCRRFRFATALELPEAQQRTCPHTRLAFCGWLPALPEYGGGRTARLLNSKKRRSARVARSLRFVAIRFAERKRLEQSRFIVQ